ncbi:MAG: DUF952 domain-containing protein [Micromonosporaceae bacterium]|jgi:uncharacterized protein (DUF952 family)
MPIVHFCPRADWEAALRAGVYAPESLRTEGFIHFSAPEQVHLPANAIARGRTDLVLLEVDEGRLAEPPRWEPGDPSDPDSMRFPHVYGPVPVSAVVAVHDFPPGPDGRFRCPPGVGGGQPGTVGGQP